MSAVQVRAVPLLEALEVHSGMVVGRRRGPLPSPEPPLRSRDIGGALEELLLPALTHPPCLVAFSGGRDSSALLAMAADVARRHGVRNPVPITLRYPEFPRTREDQWQELVIRHLGLGDWEVVPIRSEFDALGSIAREGLRSHGHYWPGNAHMTVPLLRAAAGGSLVTGNGGDEAFTMLADRRKRPVLSTLRALPWRRALLRAPYFLLPFGLRARLFASRALRLPWLRPKARRDVQRQFVASLEGGRDGARSELRKFHDSRVLELGRGIQAAFAGACGCRLVEPFLDPRFFDAAAASLPPGGFASRTAALEASFGHLLPPSVSRRTTKASFTEVLWDDESREFARDWDGTGLDLSLVDPVELKRAWSRPKPDLRSVTPLQAAWLAREGSGPRSS